MSSLKDKTVTMAHGAGGRHRHRNERQHAELHHHHLKHHQRICAEEHDEHPAKRIEHVAKRI